MSPASQRRRRSPNITTLQWPSTTLQLNITTLQLNITTLQLANAVPRLNQAVRAPLFPVLTRPSLVPHEKLRARAEKKHSPHAKNLTDFRCTSLHSWPRTPMSSSEEIFNSALSLPASQRSRLAHELLASLDEDEESGAEQAWLAEMQKRAADVEASRIELEDFGAVRARLSERLTKW